MRVSQLAQLVSVSMFTDPEYLCRFLWDRIEFWSITNFIYDSKCVKTKHVKQPLLSFPDAAAGQQLQRLSRWLIAKTHKSSLWTSLEVWRKAVLCACADTSDTLQNISPLLGHRKKYCVKIKFRSFLRLAGNILSETYFRAFTLAVRNRSLGNTIWSCAVIWWTLMLLSYPSINCNITRAAVLVAVSEFKGEKAK